MTDKTKSFYKYQSLGNDFIVFDWTSTSFSEIKDEIQKPSWSNFVKKMCERKLGIGSDGVLIIAPHENTSAIAQCFMFNPDGTEGCKCLNGIRCLALYLYQHKNSGEQFKLFMHDGFIECEIKKPYEISIKTLPAKYIKPLIIDHDGMKISGHVVDAGNPHFVIFDKKPESWLLKFGDYLEHHEAFPHRTNIELVHPDDLTVYIHERGAGKTLACGSGALAIHAALNHLKPTREITLNMLGGKLKSRYESTLVIQTTSQIQYVYLGEMRTK